MSENAFPALAIPGWFPSQRFLEDLIASLVSYLEDEPSFHDDYQRPDPEVVATLTQARFLLARHNQPVFLNETTGLMEVEKPASSLSLIHNSTTNATEGDDQ